MNILALSDTHGSLPKIDTPFDVLLICGDVCPVYCHATKFQREWVNDEFNKWISNLPFKDDNSVVVMTPGNHDFVFEGKEPYWTVIKDFELAKNPRIKVLYNETYEHTYLDNNGVVHTLSIYGTPACKVFGNWAFMYGPDTLKEMYNKCPEGVDIIISHDAPTINELGFIHEGRWSGKDAGNPLLDDLMNRVKPKYYFCGHIHSGQHAMTEHNGTMTANVSYVDEQYYDHPDNILHMVIDDATKALVTCNKLPQESIEKA